MKIQLILIILLSSLFLPFYSWSTPCPGPLCKLELFHADDFKKFGRKVVYGPYENRVIKIVYERDLSNPLNNQLYFMNTKKIHYHHDFVRDILRSSVSLNEFNSNYEGSGENREYFLGSLVLVPGDSPKILLELWSGDSLEVPYLNEFFTILKNRINIELPLFYHPLSELQVELVSNKSIEGFKYPIITNEQVFEGKEYWPLNVGEAIGKLVFVRENREGNECMDFGTIAVYDNVPNDIGMLAGVITAKPQTPLSHVNVKSMNRGTINFSLKNAFQKLKKYEGKIVHISSQVSDFKVTELSKDQASKKMKSFWKFRRPSVKLNPQFILSTLGEGRLIPFSKIWNGLPTRSSHKKLIQIIGAKATNIAVINNIVKRNCLERLGVKSPDGFALSFDHYEKFMQFEQTGLDPENPDQKMTLEERILQLLGEGDLLDTGEINSICKAGPVLEKIRKAYLQAKVPPGTIELFREKIIENVNSPIHQSKIPRVRLRSSTNSEDLEGFSGAGLYESRGVNLYKGKNKWSKPFTWKKIRKKLVKAIREIYSSVWNDRAFEEREWYSLTGEGHLNVKMGMAIHRSFPRIDFKGKPGELANGVVITKDVYSPNNKYGIYINAQHLDMAVTNPPTREELLEINVNPDETYKTEEYIVDVSSGNYWDKVNNYKSWIYNTVSKTSLFNGEPVLKDLPKVKNDPSKMEVRRVAKAFQIIKNDLAEVYQAPPQKFVLDGEWKIYGENRDIWVKQGRPLDEPKSSNRRFIEMPYSENELEILNAEDNWSFILPLKRKL